MFALVALAVAVVACGGGGGTPPAAAATVTLESSVDPGADPFTASVAISEVTSFPAEVQAVNTSLRDGLPEDDTTGTRTASGSTPGLYGGTQDDATCDTTQLVEFLTDEPAKAQAFATIVNQPVDQLADYIPTLTPVVLTADTWVTNHGFADGRPTPRQSVLQAGTAVLVDSNGSPRVKCSCGNPLAPPRTTDLTTADIQGDPWPDYQAADVTVVNPAAQPLEALTLTDIETGSQFEQPTGSNAGEPAQPSGAIDFSHELLAGYPYALQALDVIPNARAKMAADLATLEELTGFTWSEEMYIALGASFCNDWWEFEADPQPPSFGEAGIQAWAQAIAPVLGIDVASATLAIENRLYGPAPCN
jgi:hypothetical protein